MSETTREPGPTMADAEKAWKSPVEANGKSLLKETGEELLTHIRKLIPQAGPDSIEHLTTAYSQLVHVARGIR